MTMIVRSAGARFREGIVHARRFFRRDAKVAFPAVGILTLGLGANLAIFAVAHAVLLRPLPVSDQRSLVIMWERADRQATSVWEVSYRNFKDWEAENRSFSQLAATGSITWPLRLMQKDGPVMLPFAAVSGAFFDVLGVHPALGRGLRRSDDLRSSPRVAVLSDSTWRKQFASDPDVIGRGATIDDGAGPAAVTIVGVMSPEFDYPRGAALWLAMAPTLGHLSGPAGFDMIEARDLGILYVLGRLRSAVGRDHARADMDALVDRLTGTGKPGTGRSIVVTPLESYIFGQTRPALLLLMAAAVLVLFLTCANVIGLLLARLSSRRRELAIQVALGAQRSHLMRQAVAEGTALGAAGLAGSVVLALWCLPLLTALAPDTVPRLDEVTLRSPASAGFALAAGALAALACGFVPLLIVLRRPHTIVGLGEGTGRQTTLRVRHTLVTVQTAIAVVLLVVATLTVRSFHAIQRAHLGFDPSGLVTFDVLAPVSKFPKQETNDRFYRETIERVRRLPGVSAVAGVNLRPFEFGAIGSGAAIVLEGQSPRDPEAWRRHRTLNAEAVTPDYFGVMRIPVLQGRTFNDQDTAGSPPVVIVSLSAARHLWPGQNPIGRRLMASYDRPTGGWQTVVGVVGDVRYRGLTEVTLDLYKPYLQSEDPVPHFIVRSVDDPATFLGRLRPEIRSVDPGAIVDAIRPMHMVVDRELAPWRFAALLFSLLAGLALIVAVVGLYATLARQVADRTHEIGLRMALGARPAQIAGLFALRTLRVIGTGLLLGLLTAFVASGTMAALLFGVTPTGVSTYAIVCLFLLVAASAGAYWPIRRATVLDPLVALRYE
jgi:putative ABC transport system permease protein